MKPLEVTVVGAGIYGLWSAFELARRGADVRLLDVSSEPFAGSASRWAGAMLAPYCEREGAEPIVRDLGLEAMALWRQAFPGIVANGTLVVAGARDTPELKRYARMTDGHVSVDREGVAKLEPDLGGRFATGLFFRDEAHMAPLEAMAFLLSALRRLGADVRFGAAPGDFVAAAAGRRLVDCRGLAARDCLGDLRGVRGERVLIRSREVKLSRPVRLLHPRHPLYVVPWNSGPAGDHGASGGGGLFMVGATVIESEDRSPMTLRSALELLGLAYALAPALGEAEIVELGAGLRPAFPDNVPKVVVASDRIHVNGAYRHGFLLAPRLATIAADYLVNGARYPGIVVDG